MEQLSRDGRSHRDTLFPRSEPDPRGAAPQQEAGTGALSAVGSRDGRTSKTGVRLKPDPSGTKGSMCPEGHRETTKAKARATAGATQRRARARVSSFASCSRANRRPARPTIHKTSKAGWEFASRGGHFARTGVAR